MRQRKKRLTQAQKITTTAVLAALTLLFLYAAAFLPTVRLSLYALSSFFMIGLILEKEISYGWMMYIVVSILGLLLIQDKMKILPYIFFFGSYGIIKFYIEKAENIVVEILIKLAYFSTVMLLSYVFASQILFSDIKIKLPIWVILLGAQFIFFIFDYIYSRVIIFYEIRIRKYVFGS